MKLAQLVEAVSDEPLFETGLLLVGDVDPRDVRRQLSRWCRAGKVLQVRRGLYALEPPYRKRRPHPFVVANRVVRGSYVSAQSALAHHGAIPEFVAEITSVTAGGPCGWKTPLGRFSYRHVQKSWFRGYRLLSLGEGAEAFVATPEKALLDLVYLTPAADAPEFLRTLRLNPDKFDMQELARLASGRPKLERTVAHLRALFQEEAFESL